MIEIRLKRTGENKSVTFGELRIPKVGFACKTLELRDGAGLTCKQSCRIPEGQYICELKVNKSGIFCPHLKYKVRGFAVKPEFDFENDHFTNLPTGFISIGRDFPDAYSIMHSKEINEAFSDSCRRLFHECCRDTIILNVYKVVDYTKTDEDYDEEVSAVNYNFLEGLNDDQTELDPLEHDSVDG